MTNTENEFELDGKVYVAEYVGGSSSCFGCHFASDDIKCGELDEISAWCGRVKRQDNRNVIFKEKV